MDTINELYNEAKGAIALNPEQDLKMRQACERAYHDNRSYDEQLEAAKIYLRYILEFPQLTL